MFPTVLLEGPGWDWPRDMHASTFSLSPSWASWIASTCPHHQQACSAQCPVPPNSLSSSWGLSPSSHGHPKSFGSGRLPCCNWHSPTNPDGLQVDSSYSSRSLSGLLVESIRSLYTVPGVHQESYQGFVDFFFPQDCKAVSSLQLKQ